VEVFFYGYVFGFTEKIGIDRFSGLIDKQYCGENIRRLIQCVVANLLYPDMEPDWATVLIWEAQAVAYGNSQNNSYDEGLRTGTLLGEEILNGKRNFSCTLLGTELLKPL
jgi:hypothetical protein